MKPQLSAPENSFEKYLRLWQWNIWIIYIYCPLFLQEVTVFSYLFFHFTEICNLIIIIKFLYVSSVIMETSDNYYYMYFNLVLLQIYRMWFFVQLLGSEIILVIIEKNNYIYCFVILLLLFEVSASYKMWQDYILIFHVLSFSSLIEIIMLIFARVFF